MQSVSQFGTPLLPDLVWSYSRLDSFETCPKRFAATMVHKSHVEAQDGKRASSLAYGDAVHREMDAYIRLGKLPSLAQTKFKLVVDKVTKDAVSVTSELKVGLTRDLRLTAFFNDDVALRVIIDLTAEHRDGSLVVVDWKTSSAPREKPLQLKLSALAGMALRPSIKRVYAAYVYPAFPSKQEVVNRGDISGIVQELNPRLDKLKAAIDADSFPARQCWACSFCPVTECAFNRARRT